jgi:nicotinamidase-related amidase
VTENISKVAFLFYTDLSILVIDMQHFLLRFAKHAEPYSGNQVLANANKLIELAENMALPVALIAVTQKFLPRRLRDKMTQLAIKKELMADKAATLYTKYQPSAYSIPELQDFLNKNQIETVMLSGIVSNNGVLKTAKDFLSAGYKVILIEDAMIARTQKLHDQSIFELETLGASIQTTNCLNDII